MVIRSERHSMISPLIKHNEEVLNFSDGDHGGDGDALLKDKSSKKLFGMFLI